MIDIDIKSDSETDTSKTLNSDDRTEDRLSRDEAFDLLRNSRRRAVLNHLRNSDSSSTLGELAERIAADENDLSTEQLSSQQRKRVYVSLYQNHLSKINDAGLIEYDQDRGTVELRECPSVCQYLLSDDDPGAPRYLYVALLVPFVVTVGLLGIGPASAVSVTVWTLISMIALLVILVAELYRQNWSPI